AFRWLESFAAARRIYGEPQRRHLAAALDVLARTFNGGYLLVEAATLGDAMAVDGFAPLGPATAAAVNAEAQRLWFLALACAVAAALERLVRGDGGADADASRTGEGEGESGRGEGE